MPVYSISNKSLCRSVHDERLFFIVQFNCNGVFPRLSELRLYMYHKKPDIVCLCETRVAPAMSEPHFAGYQSVWRHRPNRGGGGLCILVRNDIPFSVSDLIPFQNGQLEFQSVRLSSFFGSLDILNLYNPCANVSYEELSHLSSQLCPANVVVGDLNAHSPLWDQRGRSNFTGRGVELFLDSHSHGLLNPFYSPTYIDSRSGTTSCLDLCLASLPLLSYGSFATGPDIGSDHLPVECSFDFCVKKTQICGPPRWLVGKGNWPMWHDDLNGSSFDTIVPASASALNEDFCSRLLAISSKNIPQSTGGNRQHRCTPWWDADCSRAVAQRRRARLLLSHSPTQQNLIAYKRCTAIARHLIRKKKKNSWRQFVNSLTIHTPGAIVWRTIRSINGVRSAPPVIPVGGPDAQMPERAQLLLEHFVPLPPLLEGPHATVVKDCVSSLSLLDIDETDYNLPFTRSELVHALRFLKNTSPGHDSIINEFLKRLPLSFLDQLLYLYNISFFTGVVPQSWKLGIICPIPKPNRDHSGVAGYRPITLLSCVGKLMERLVGRRLVHFLESNASFTCLQTGFRRGRSTADALVLIKSCISGALSHHAHCVTVYLDLAQAYDCVWHDGVLYKLKMLGCDLRTLLWIKSFLGERTVRVRVGEAYSETRPLTRGLPQGAVLSPTLFNVMLSDLPTSPHVKLVSYADDITCICTGVDFVETQFYMQSFLDRLTTWLTRWDLKVNPAKSSCQLYTRSRRVPPLLLRVSGHLLSVVPEQRVLGVILDAPRLSMAPHVRNVKVECMRRLNILRALSGLRWGSSRELLRLVYIAFIRSKLCYGYQIYPELNAKLLNVLSLVQNSALRCVLGARKTTPIISLEVESYIMPLNLYLQLLFARWCLRQSCGPCGISDLAGVVGLFSSPPTSCFSERRLSVLRKVDLPITLRGAPASYFSPVSPSIDLSDMVSLTAPSFSAPSFLAVNSLFESFLTDHYHSRVTIYTDGSKLDGGSAASGLYIPSLNISIAWLLNPSHSIAGAELFAILRAIRLVRGDSRLRHKNVVILTDSLSSLQIISNTEQTSFRSFVYEIQSHLLATSGRILLQWIPAHRGIDGNEIADSIAKRGHSNSVSALTSLNYEELLVVINRAFLSYWEVSWHEQARLSGKGQFLSDILEKPCKRVSIPGTSRRVNCAIARLRLGHAGVHNHLFRFRLVDSPLCTTCNVPETIPHYLLDCPFYGPVRSVLQNRLRSMNVPFTLSNVLGCGDQSSRDRQWILSALAGFLSASNRIALL